jgi:hypothetical protein
MIGPQVIGRLMASILTRSKPAIGRYGELTITAIMCIDRLCVAEEILTWEIATNIG